MFLKVNAIEAGNLAPYLIREHKAELPFGKTT